METRSNNAYLPAMLRVFGFLMVAFLAAWSCKPPEPMGSPPLETPETTFVSDVPAPPDYDTTAWTELTPDKDFYIDIRYATTDNFVHEVIYPCGRCFLKPGAARALMGIRDELKQKGYRIKLFDCYRPGPAQQKLWDKVPDPDYVANPAEGSMHNRGVAVDLTLTDLQGKDLDMGTAYDFFGPEAHHDYAQHPEAIRKNRLILKNAMEAAGFQSIRTEWWHYSYGGIFPPIESWQWPCP
jgi:D-alanyl-D-alanine dipeptidase